MLPFQWSHPTRVVFGEGVLAQLGDLVNEVAGRQARVFLLTGQRSLERNGVLGRVLGLLGPDRLRRFSDIPAFPSPATARAAVAACRDARAHVVVAVGGGSDGNIFNAAGVTCIVLSTGMADVHTVHEHIAVADMIAGTELLLASVQRLAG